MMKALDKESTYFILQGALGINQLAKPPRHQWVGTVTAIGIRAIGFLMGSKRDEVLC